MCLDHCAILHCRCTHSHSLFFLAILELNFLALLSSFMIPSGLISHSRKVKRPLHDTFVSRDRKNVAGQRFMDEKDTKLKIVQKFFVACTEYLRPFSISK